MGNFVSSGCFTAPHLRRSESGLSVGLPSESKGAEESPRVEEFYDAPALPLPEKLSAKVRIDEANKSIEGELHIANVTSKEVADVIKNFKNYSKQHVSVVSTNVEEKPEGLLVTMTTKVAGITDTLPLMHTFDEDGSCFTIKWSLQKGTESRFLTKNKGSFAIRPHEDNGVILIHKLSLSPKWVPNWLISKFLKKASDNAEVLYTEIFNQVRKNVEANLT